MSCVQLNEYYFNKQLKNCTCDVLFQQYCKLNQEHVNTGKHAVSSVGCQRVMTYRVDINACTASILHHVISKF